jgi:hypothetical protein
MSFDVPNEVACSSCLFIFEIAIALQTLNSLLRDTVVHIIFELEILPLELGASRGTWNWNLVGNGIGISHV